MKQSPKTNNANAAKQQGAKSECADKNCPIHHGLKARGREFTGLVVSDKMLKTVVVSWSRRLFVKKFERYERKRSKINAHNPECINAKKGDLVKIIETRPLSKTKSFVVIEILGAASKKESIKAEAFEENEIIDAKKARAAEKEQKEQKEQREQHEE
jgi:small subunit ribosomal protein S17